jgi:hypothetical protein
MIALLVQMVPLGLAAAASPVPIMTGITFSSGRNPTLRITVYLLGGLLTYAVIGAIGVAIISATSKLGTHGHPSTLALVIRVVIGALLLAFALFYLALRKVNSGPPRWMQALESFGPSMAFLTGIVILSPHLKNLALLAAAVNAAGSAHLGFVRSAIAILLFMGITLSPVLAPLFVNLTQPPDRAAATTGAWRTWLEKNNYVILAVVLGFMGLKLLEEGLVGLLS